MKQGTVWVKPGEGATIKELLSVEYPKGKEFDHIIGHSVRNINGISEDDGHNTNLALSGGINE